jgi:hypothetical protein
MDLRRELTHVNVTEPALGTVEQHRNWRRRPFYRERRSCEGGLAL